MTWTVDTAKLRALSEWLDAKYADDGEVQRDLRTWAAEIDALKARADKTEASRDRLAALVRAMDLYDRESNGGLDWNAKNKARMGLIVARAAVDAAGDLEAKP